MIAKAIAKALGGHRTGTAWMACCPAHKDREPSLSISSGKDGRMLVHCHAGCDQTQVIAALRSRGLWEGSRKYKSPFIRQEPCQPDSGRPDRGDAKRSEAAMRIWRAAEPAAGTPVETYLQSRGLHLAPPSTMRFHVGLEHPSGGIWLAMVALVTRGVDDVPIAIHRTFIASDGAGKAPVEPQKMMLGPCSGGAVRLAPPGRVLMVGEGIETCLAAMQATGTPAWAALSTSGLRTLDLPHNARDVIVLADGDDPGEAAALDCAWRWRREGRRVRIARPPMGMDFNDLLKARLLPIEEGAP